MIQIFDEWVQKDVGQVFIQLFDVTLANWLGTAPGLCVYSETCGEGLPLNIMGMVTRVTTSAIPNISWETSKRKPWLT
jgi:uncharacterized protein